MNTIDYKVYNVSPRKDADAFWNNVGGAFRFTTKDGRQGINIPNLNLVLVEPKADNDNPKQQESA